MTIKTIRIDLILLAVVTTAIMGQVQPVVAANQERPYFMNDGQKQYLRISLERVAVRFQAELSFEQIDSIIGTEPLLLSAWAKLALAKDGLVVGEVLPGRSKTEIFDLISRLNERSGILSAGPSYSAGEDVLIPTDRLLIQFKPKTTQLEIAELNSRFSVTIEKELGWLKLAYVLKLTSPGQAVFEIANRLSDEPTVAFCHPNFVRLIKPLSTTPNDTHFGDQWNLSNSGSGGGLVGADIDMPEAWDHARGFSSVSIAVIDEGVDTTHEDLSSKIVNQYDATDQDNDQQPNSWDGHGTAIAGVIAAQPDNSFGVAGVAWNCSVMPVRMAYKVSPLPVLWVTSDEVIADAIATATIRGADVLNCSWGLTYSSEIIQAAIRFAKREGRGGKGCVIVGSAGNSDGSAILFPAAYDEVIAVGATNEWDERKSKISQDGETNWGSNYGPELDVVAPGVHIWTTDIMGSGGFNTGNPLYGDSIGNYWSRFNGTSSAVPHVAGLAALILSIDPELTSDEVQEIIQASADDLVGLPGEDSPGWDQYMGYGRINVHAAVENLSSILYVGGTILQNSVWDTSKVYVVTNDLMVPSGVTLTIEAGTVVKFDYQPLSPGIHQRNKLIVEGSLIVQGTPAEPVVFTSIRDDEHGGDTNGDGSASLPQAGDWGSIRISSSNSQFENCIVRYAGVGWFDQSDTSPFEVAYYDKQAVWLDGVSTGVSVRSCLIENYSVSGGEETTNSRAVYWDASETLPGVVLITDNSISGGQDGIVVNGQAVGSSATIEGNVFTNLTGTGISCAGLTDPISVVANVISGGTRGILCSDCGPNLIIDSNQIINQMLAGLELRACDATVMNNTFEQTESYIGQGAGLNLTHGSNVLVEGNAVIGFDIGLKSESGEANDPCELNIRLNSIANNQSAGVRLASTDISAATGPTAVINDNDLFDNDTYNLSLGDYQNPSQVTIEAENNWWGTAVELDLAATIYEHDDDANSPRADYLPFRTRPVLTPELHLEPDQSQTKVALFPDSITTREFIIYNYASDAALTFSIEEAVGSGALSVASLNLTKRTVAELGWLDVQPTNGVVPPEDSAVINLSYDASGLVDSTYVGFLIIKSNDPDQNPFVIPVALDVSPVFLLSPNGGEQFESGETQAIVWELVNPQLVVSVVIRLSTDGGETFPSLVAVVTSDSAHFEWTIPSEATDSGRIMAEVYWSSGTQSRDESDSLFTIVIGAYFCGQYNSGHTGNTNCDLEGKRNLADITRLVDRVYLTKLELCDRSEGNINGDPDGKLNLADVTRLIDHVYLSKTETAVCQ